MVHFSAMPEILMPHILFISDLHLSPQTPELLQQFQRFLRQQLPAAEAVYILGDLFDAWIGDDDPSAFATEIKSWLHQASTHTPLYFQHGNRDFLLGSDFAAEAGMNLLPEAQVIQVAGQSVLLLHGDQLCTDDVDYQRARTLFRSPEFFAQAMQMSIPERIEKAKQIRQMSGEATQMKSAQIMDVNQTAVEAIMVKHGVQQLIHGHTHRPDTHNFTLKGKPAQRHVLADWKNTGSYALRMDLNRFTPQSVPV